MRTPSSIYGIVATLCVAAHALPGMAMDQSTVVDAEVVDVQPLVEVVTERIPSETCRPERVFVPDRKRFASVIPTVVGALLGGSVANVLGRNSSKRGVITGAGAVLGGTVGYQRHRRENGDTGYYVTEEVCITEYELRERERVDGYRVSYRFGGSIYQTRSETDPGSTIPVRVRLEPLQ